MDNSKNKLKKFPIRKLTITSKRQICLGINLTKVAQDLYIENYKTFLRDIKENLNKWKNIPYSWLGSLNIVKVEIPPKLICRLNIIPTKSQQSFFVSRN